MGRNPHGYYGTLRILLALYVALQIQPATFSQAPGGIFYQLTKKNGLSSNRITHVIQDQKGYYWIGTEDGLNRFDGSQCKTFRSEMDDSFSLSNNHCTSLLEDDSGNIWVGTQQGISVYHPVEGRFRRCYLDNPATTRERVNWIRGLAKDDKGNIYICSYGLWIYNVYTKKWKIFLHRRDDPSSAPEGYLFSPVFDPAHEVLWSKSAEGFICFDILFEKFNNRLNNPHHLQIMTGAVDDCNMQMDRDGHIWTYDPVHHALLDYSTLDDRIQRFETERIFDVQQLSVDDQDRIWIQRYRAPTLIFSAGHSAPDSSFLSRSRFQPAVSNKSVLLLIDREGNYWLGSDFGVSIYDSRSRSVHYHVLSPSGTSDDNTFLQITCMTEDSSGHIWVGTNLGLLRYDKADDHCVWFRNLFLEDAYVRSLLLAGNDKLWIGGQHGLAIMPLRKGETAKFIATASAVQCLYEAGNGHIWTGTWSNGLYEFDSKGDLLHHISKTPSEGRSPINNLLCIHGRSSDSYFWIGYNGGNGFSRFDPGMDSISFFKLEAKNLQNIQNIINCIYEDRSGNVWVGTYGSGLVKMEAATRSYKKYSQAEGLSGNYINAITEDRFSRLWINTSNGIDILDERTGSILNTDLDMEQPNNDLVASAVLRKNGGLLFFARNRFVEIAPDSFPLRALSHHLLLNSFRIFDKEVRLADTAGNRPILLDHDQNAFAFEYALLKLNPEGHVQYAYKLDGLDPDWNLRNDRGLANYTNIPPGNYTFRVKARDMTGQWAYYSTPLFIQIAPPFWRTWWFISFVLLLLATSVYSLFQYRISQVRRFYQLRSDISKDLHDQIGATLTSISFLSEVAKKETDAKPSSSGTLERIGQYSRDMISEMNDIVWVINPRNDSFEKIVDRIQDYALVLCGSKNIHFTLESNPEFNDLSLTMRQRKNLFLALKEAINNAVKHSGCTELSVRFTRSGTSLRADISDNGAGMASKSQTGNGLINMQQRAEELGGRLNIQSMPGKGSLISLIMPITQNTY